MNEQIQSRSADSEVVIARPSKRHYVLTEDDIAILIEMAESYKFSRRFWKGTWFWINRLLVTGGAIAGLIMAYRTINR